MLLSMEGIALTQSSVWLENSSENEFRLLLSCANVFI